MTRPERIRRPGHAARLARAVLLPALPLLAVVPGSPDARAQTSPLVREPGAIYLEETAPGLRLRLDVREPAAVFADIGGTRHVGVLVAPQKVEVLAVSGDLIRVRGKARHGQQVVGWVKPAFLSPLPDGFLDDMRRAEQRRIEVEQVIARKDVVTGMTMDEVRRSLGRPQRRSSRVSGGTRADVWEFVTYQIIPQERDGIDEFGRLTRVIVSVKVPVGTRRVVFENGVVTEITEDTETRGGRRPLIAPGSVELY